MEIDLVQLKLNAKDAIKKKENRAILASIAVFLLLYALTWLLIRLSGYSEWYSGYSNFVVKAFKTTGTMQPVPYDVVAWPKVGTAAIILCVVIYVLRMVLSGGYSSWCLKAARGETPHIKCIFDGFSYFGQVLLLSILKGIIVAVGLCVFIVPGIYFACRYSLAFYAFFDDPRAGAIGAMRRSAQLTKGHKFEVIKLTLSFILWFLAAEIIASFTISLLDVWVRPYYGLTYAYYYDAAVSRTDGTSMYNDNEETK
ncbi:MAG: DUF975 family protein [Oscillospiraceae bacterium]|nr:DUF975 family protein [Oscillospiraceae bacterium]